MAVQVGLRRRWSGNPEDWSVLLTVATQLQFMVNERFLNEQIFFTHPFCS